VKVNDAQAQEALVCSLAHLSTAGEDAASIVYVSCFMSSLSLCLSFCLFSLSPLRLLTAAATWLPGVFVLPAYLCER
jgi:hypothetical protein